MVEGVGKCVVKVWVQVVVVVVAVVVVVVGGGGVGDGLLCDALEVLLYVGERVVVDAHDVGVLVDVVADGGGGILEGAGECVKGIRGVTVEDCCCVSSGA